MCSKRPACRQRTPRRAYGHTLGNALRRVLLSSMIGYAPT
ncbi:hypothetical protein, partial [Paraburkholderia dipogonis]